MDSKSSQSRRAFWISAILFLGTLVLFSRGTQYDFTQYDDPSYVTNNPAVRSGFTAEGLRWAFQGATANWHPLTWMSHMLDSEVYGLNAFGHHLSGVLWHSATAVMALLVFRRCGLGLGASAFIAALFAWHPLRVESVTWISERKDVMSGFFFQLTLWLYLGYGEKRAQGAKPWREYVGACLAFTAALMCKPVMVAGPVVLCLLDLWPLGRLQLLLKGAGRKPEPWSLLVAEKLPFFVFSAVIAAITVHLQHSAGAFGLRLTAWERIANAAVSVPRYLGKFFWPSGLAVSYPHPGSWPFLIVFASLVLVLAVTVYALVLSRREPRLLVGWGWYLVMLLPTLGLIQVGFQSMADRYTYSSILGLQLAVVAPALDWLGRQVPRKALAVAGAVILAACGVRTWQQQATWRDSRTLFTHALQTYPANAPAHAFLALQSLSEGQIEDASAHAEKAVALDPRFVGALDTLAIVRRAQGRLDEAIAGFRQVLKTMPEVWRAKIDLAAALTEKGDWDEAKSLYEEILREHPGATNARVAYAVLENRRGQPAEAVRLLEEAVRRDPTDSVARTHLASALASQRRLEEAAGHFEEVVRLSPQAVESHYNYSTVLRELKRFSEALTEARIALDLQPDNPMALQALISAAGATGQPDEALAELRRAVDTHPGSLPLRLTYGDLLGQRGKMQEAADQYAEAVRRHPGRADARARLGYLHLLLQRPREALKEWEEALRIDPTLPGLKQRADALRESLP